MISKRNVDVNVNVNLIVNLNISTQVTNMTYACRTYACNNMAKCYMPLAFRKQGHKNDILWIKSTVWSLFVCVEVLRPSQPNGVMSSVVSLPNHTFTRQA